MEAAYGEVWKPDYTGVGNKTRRRYTPILICKSNLAPSFECLVESNMQDLSKVKVCASEYRRNNLAEKETKELKIMPEPCFIHTREDDHVIILRPDDKSDLAKHIREKRSFRQCPNCGWLVSCPKI